MRKRTLYYLIVSFKQDVTLLASSGMQGNKGVFHHSNLPLATFSGLLAGQMHYALKARKALPLKFKMKHAVFE